MTYPTLIDKKTGARRPFIRADALDDECMVCGHGDLVCNACYRDLAGDA